MANNLLQSTAHTSTIPFSRPPTPGAHPLQIGFCGLGAMGYFMARNLANSFKSQLPPLLVYNRTVAKSQKLLTELGASAVKVADTLDQLVRECDVVFTNLGNDAVVTSIYNEFAKALAQSPPTKVKIFVEMSTCVKRFSATNGTMNKSAIGDLNRLLSSHPHVRFITSPIFGPPPAADKGMLIIAMSGDCRSKKEVAFLLVPAVGRKVIDLGENVEKAPTLKLIGNGMIMSINELLAETLTLGEKSGIGQQTVYDLVKEIMPAPILVAYGHKMVNDLFDGSVGFSIDGGVKDASHVRRLSAELNCPMPAVDNTHRGLITARAIHQAQVAAGTQQWDILDWSALIASSRVAAGLNPFDSKKGTGVVRED
ncbi:NAD(P)-binding protein [Suillus subaureus]|uniref:NAD(P)-binding protein n=1 Tax=Suillus subaureus TaxID=48587 RepID=A0A9P7JJ21_9AGAM|nr:NAD(P)-binding protein [Suillus subaureus]KAG1825670.1 NAD(P)-binding protein [Suillus subaureus]